VEFFSEVSKRQRNLVENLKRNPFGEGGGDYCKSIAQYRKYFLYILCCELFPYEFFNSLFFFKRTHACEVRKC